MKQRIGRYLWATYLFLWAWSVPLLALDIVPAGGEWMGTVMLVLSGGLCGWWLVERYRGTGALVVLLILVLSWAAEHLGVTTGWPFGAYRYNGVLLPEIIGVVPLAIPFAWLLVVPGAIEWARLMLRSARVLPLIGLAATLAMLLDMVIEPVAVYVNGYWTWVASGPLFGIPTSNFVAWWCVAALLAAISIGVLRHVRSTPSGLSLPALMYALNLLLFTVVDLTHGHIGAGVVGTVLLLIGGVVWQRRALRLRVSFDALR